MVKIERLKNDDWYIMWVALDEGETELFPLGVVGDYELWNLLAMQHITDVTIVKIHDDPVNNDQSGIRFERHHKDKEVVKIYGVGGSIE